jgi:PleD family two-component response regulator
MSDFNRMRTLTTLVLSFVRREQDGSNAHILFADDDPDIRELIHFVLSRAGFRVSATGSLAEVLTLAATERFDALLLDNWRARTNRRRTLSPDPYLSIKAP